MFSVVLCEQRYVAVKLLSQSMVVLLHPGPRVILQSTYWLPDASDVQSDIMLDAMI